jgi:hypothetical protein
MCGDPLNAHNSEGLQDCLNLVIGGWYRNAQGSWSKNRHEAKKRESAERKRVTALLKEADRGNKAD